MRSENNKFIDLIWNKEEFPHLWKELIVVPIRKECGKIGCSNYRGISLLSTSYKILACLPLDPRDILLRVQTRPRTVDFYG
jgi:hypothetical protein